MASDTTSAAQKAQVIAARRLGHAGRLRAAAELSEDVCRISVESVLRRHPRLFLRASAARSPATSLGRSACVARLAVCHAMSSLQGLLERIVPALQNAGVPYMLAGSFASAAHVQS